MLRRGEQRLDRRFLDDAAGVHDRHAVGHLGDDAEVVRDEQQREAQSFLEIAQQVEDLRLDRHVERRRGLVGDEERRPAGERQGDERALAQPARELMRILAHAPLRLGYADGREQLDRLLPRVRARRASVNAQRLLDLIPDRVDRVERGHRLLEDEADLGAAHVLHLALGQRQEIPSLEENLS